MTYEYNRKQGGLGALGWTTNWFVPMSDEVRRNQPCTGGGTMVCGRSPEQSWLTTQGCTPTTYQGLDACRTSAGNAGSLFCCPPGRPSTEPGTASPIVQPGVTRSQMMALQRWVNQQSGCSAGSVDGVWGPATRRGVECVVAATSWVNVTGRFPWITTMMATPTGQARSDSFTFTPGTTPSKPGASTSTSGQAATTTTTTPTSQPATTTTQRTAGLGAALPWWGWGLIAVAGVATLGVVAALALGGGKEEDFEAEEFLPPRRRRF